MPEGSLSNVTEHLAGSELDVDATAGFSQIFVVDIDEFDEDGGTLSIGTETYAYTVPVDSEGEIDLVTPLLTTHLAGEPVLQSPPLVERVAWILDTEQEEELKARIPHALFDAIALGARNGDAEVVEYDLRGEELVVLDVLGREPIRDGSFIDPTTLPPPTGSDGTPPTSSPTPVVISGLGTLFVQWLPITNPDPVTYEVHLSTSSGFIPDSTTFVTDTDGSLINLKVLPGTTTPLDYDTVYYVRLIAKDDDGKGPTSPEASGQPSKVNSPDIAVNTILAGHLLAGEITADKLAAILIISNAIKTAEEGQRVELDALGIRLIAQSGDTLVELPTDPGASASFAGSIVANALTVLDQLSIRGANNVVDSGGVVTVSSSLSTPSTAPVVTIDNDTFALNGIEDGGDYLTNRGLFYDTSGFGGVPTLLSCAVTDPHVTVYEHLLDGSLLRSTDMAPFPLPWNRVCGITRRGGVIYLLGWWNAFPQQLQIQRLRQSDFQPLNRFAITAPHQADLYRSTISTIGTSVMVWGFTGTSPSEQIERHEFTDDDTNAGAWTYVGQVNYSGLTFDGRAGGDTLEGHVRVGTQDWIAHDRDGIHGANSFATVARTFEDETGFVGSGRGIAYDGTGFLSRGAGRVTNHTEWDWADNKAYLSYCYSWRDDTVNNYESLPSPQKALNVRPDGPAHRAYRRNRIKVTIPSLPASVPKFRLYMGHAISQAPLVTASLFHQTATAYISTQSVSPTYQTDEITSSIHPRPDAGNTSVGWPGATSKIKSQTSSWELTGSDAKGLLGLTQVATARRIDFGVGSVNVSSVNGATATIAHSLGVTPTVVLITPGQTTNTAVIARTNTWTTTNFVAGLSNRDAATNFPAATTISFAWLAIG